MSVDLEKAPDDGSHRSSEGDHYHKPVANAPAPSGPSVVTDLRVLPTLALAYMLQTWDRTAVSFAVDHNARLFGRSHGESKTYTGIYYLGFILCVLPTIVLLPKLGEKTTLSCLMLGFGAMTMIQAGTSSWAGLAAVQFFVGAFQAGFWATIVAYVAAVYRPAQLGLRLAVIYGLGVALGSFNGPISYTVFNHLSGSPKPWKDLMLIEGGVTLAFAPLLLLLLPRTTEASNFTIGSAVKTVFRPTTAVFAVIALFLGAAASSCELVIYQMLKTLSTDSMKESLDAVAVYTTGFVILLLIAISSDHYRERSTHIAVPLVVSLVVLVNLTTVYYIHKRASAYFNAYIISTTVMMAPLFNAWYVNNIAEPAARLAAIGIVVGSYHVGDLLGWVAFWNTTLTTKAGSSGGSGGGGGGGHGSKRAETTTADDLQGLKIACAYTAVVAVAVFAQGAWLKRVNRRQSTGTKSAAIDAVDRNFD
ncbi:MFS general substrate transporter [Teratosphaeria nubilosa]|uniref:MFS general substrate transporter n=1 Tax=Teratosphaeria nubilosa TaxID=161662 RepID=A0A6G1LNV3_9PEZI|nr:MFS general substrate transporter [Teratosphaeria nubilosa]